MKLSISDDDLCATCQRCNYNPGEISGCSLDFPGERDEDGYVVACVEIRPVQAWGENVRLAVVA